MFIGHFGVGFGAKALAPRTSLGSLFLAAQFVDLLLPVLLLAGVEQLEVSPGFVAVTPLEFTQYPVSHSLLAVLLWAVLFGGVYYLFNRYHRGAWVCAAVLLSHWGLDALVHIPDLPLYPGSNTLVGLGLWQSLPATLLVEGSVFVAGVVLYLRTTRALDRTGSVALWMLVALLLIIYVANLTGPPPPNVMAFAWGGMAQWLFVVWAYWIARHRAIAT